MAGHLPTLCNAGLWCDILSKTKLFVASTGTNVTELYPSTGYKRQSQNEMGSQTWRKKVFLPIFILFVHRKNLHFSSLHHQSLAWLCKKSYTFWRRSPKAKVKTDSKIRWPMFIYISNSCQLLFYTLHCNVYILYYSDLFSTAVRHSNFQKLHSKFQFCLSKPVCNELFMSIPWLFAPQISFCQNHSKQLLTYTRHSQTGSRQWQYHSYITFCEDKEAA